jgi:hypothetical protein
MVTQDLASSIKVLQAITPASITATETAGTTIDTQGYESCTFILNLATAATFDEATNLWTVKLEESDDNFSTHSDVASTDLIGTVGGDADMKLNAAADDDRCWKIGYKGSKRYVRITVNETGAITCIASASCILAHGRKKTVAFT